MNPQDAFRATSRGIGGECSDERRKFFGNSSSYADIPVMQTSEYRSGDEFAWAGDFGWFHLYRRRVPIEALMGSCHMIILIDEFAK
jgi:hypothetical protein